MISNNYSTALNSRESSVQYKITDDNRTDKNEEILNEKSSKKRDEIKLRLQKQNELSALTSSEAENTVALLKATLFQKPSELISAQGDISSEAVSALLAN